MNDLSTKTRSTSPKDMSLDQKLFAAISIVQAYILAEDTACIPDQMFGVNYLKQPSLEMAERLLMDIVPDVQNLLSDLPADDEPPVKPTVEPHAASPSRHVYLNPDFMPNYAAEEYCRTHRASGLAYEVRSIVAAAHSAFENDGSGIPMEERGIAPTLEIAVHMASDLIDLCETLEQRLVKAKEADDCELKGSSRIQELFQEHQRLGKEASAYAVPEGADAEKVLEALFWGRRDKIEEEMMASSGRKRGSWFGWWILGRFHEGQGRMSPTWQSN